MPAWASVLAIRQAAISLHLYGPRTGSLDGHDYDPMRDFVCDWLGIDIT
jgi:hypothetical protein